MAKVIQHNREMRGLAKGGSGDISTGGHHRVISPEI